jgi:protein TonB
MIIMEEKKNPKLDLHSKHNLFLSIGLIVSLGIVISAFEWKSFENEKKVQDWELKSEFDLEDEVLITKQPEPEPPKPKVVPREVIETKEEPEIDPKEFLIDTEITEDPLDDFEFEIPDDKIEDDQIFIGIVEENPEPEGGYEAFYSFLAKELNYPKLARKMGVEGRVFVSFIVNKDGQITDIEVVKGIGAGCDVEAERVMKYAPKWKPGKQRGRPVRVKMVVPIVFSLK